MFRKTVQAQPAAETGVIVVATVVDLVATMLKREGIEYMFGIPGGQATIDLLDATAATGITLTESNAMFPASSVSGMYLNHPESKYFAVGKLGKDQIEEYSAHKGQLVVESERWLAPYLDY